MSLNLAFDGVTVDEDNIIGFKLYTPVFGDTFKMGQAICRTAKVQVLKSVSIPDTVSFTLPTNYETAYLHVDAVDDSDDTYYELSLLDNMVYLNKQVDFSLCETAEDALDKITDEFGFSYQFEASEINPLSYAFAWDGVSTARDVVSMIAEAYGGFAIFSNTTLQFKRYRLIPSFTIPIEDCGDITIGDAHNITRIAYDNGLDVYEYGSASGDTIYISQDNVFFGDASNTQQRIEDIGDFIIGNQFNNITVQDAPIVQTSACDFITIGTYNLYVQEDWVYNGDWIGGYSFQVKTAEQEETDVVPSELEKQVASIKTTVNRQEGQLDILGSRTDGIETDLIHFQVDAVNSEVKVTNQDSDSPTSYTSFKGDGMRIYVDGEQVAEATAMRFECDKGLGVQDWAIEQGSSPNSLIFYRKG